MNPSSGASILVPLEITGAMIKAGTSIAEPDTSRGEVAWVSGGSYTVDQERTYGHAIYSCVKDHSSSTITPDLDATNWLRKQPTNLFAPFDFYRGTKALGTGAVTYVMQPGFFSDVDLRGLVGDRVQIRVKDQPGGTVTKEMDVDLWEQAAGLYELLFMPLRKGDQAELTDIPISPDAELTVIVSGGPSAEVGVGTMSIGTWQHIIGTSDFGGTERGATARPRSYSYVKYNDDGTYEYKKRRSAIDISFSVVTMAEEGPVIAALLDSILDIPVAVKATNLPKYSYLSTVGVVDGTVSADGPTVKVTVNVKGFI